MTTRPAREAEKPPDLRVHHIMVHLRKDPSKPVSTDTTDFSSRNWKTAIRLFLDHMKETRETVETLKYGHRPSISFDRYNLRFAATPNGLLYYLLTNPYHAEAHPPQRLEQKQTHVCLGENKIDVERALENFITFDSVRMIIFDDLGHVRLFLWKNDDETISIEHQLLR